ncbi:hypothetical protein Psfp_01444 [Pelotomaculum sp. FP]|nr:hypothetical protein Psfp_01444 [Pelotomaculum sp. FP]
MKQKICCLTGYKHIKLHYGDDEEHSILVQLKIRQRRFRP